MPLAYSGTLERGFTMLSFNNAPQNLFNRLGALGNLLLLLRQYQLDLQTSMTGASGVTSEYTSEADLQAEMGSAYLGCLSAAEACASTAQGLAQDTVNRMVFRDNPRIAQNLNSLNVPASLREIIRQMNQQGATIQAQTVTGTPSAFTGTGDGQLVCSVLRRRVDPGECVCGSPSGNVLCGFLFGRRDGRQRGLYHYGYRQ